MRKVNRGVFEAQQVNLALLDYCLALAEQREPVVAVCSNDGWLLSTNAAWQHQPQVLVNLMCLMDLQTNGYRHRALAAEHVIRNLLHDAADLRSAAQHDQSLLALDQTRAQQALEDLVIQAMQLQASDIHLVFQPTVATLAFRVHGRLVSRIERGREVLAAAIAAALNTRSDDFHELFDEQRLSSASISLTIVYAEQPQRLRLRVQKSPTRSGFAVTMRLQYEQQEIASLTELGMPADLVETLTRIIRAEHGLILVAGPTGQGKSTTLAAINLIIPTAHKVISLEDPIEIIQPQIEQKPVLADHPELNFANMVKIALREDPDVISISEIRDSATAKAAFTAALTGHLVTATVHAHDSLGVVQRLLDLGLSGTMLAQPGVLQGILAQRLEPVPCSACQTSTPATASETACSHCLGTGVIGRRWVGELLTIDDYLRAAIRTENLAECQRILVTRGWPSLASQRRFIDQPQRPEAESLCV
ncbi:MAG TPA: ATPase, T2SS/T4P/T4SS family [Pseudidiomarina sp.]|nr:ATPase, T2SS/T4P/T4SS family [Pseudidiomarina sp.]